MNTAKTYSAILWWLRELQPEVGVCLCVCCVSLRVASDLQLHLLLSGVKRSRCLVNDHRQCSGQLVRMHGLGCDCRFHVTALSGPPKILATICVPDLHATLLILPPSLPHLNQRATLLSHVRGFSFVTRSKRQKKLTRPNCGADLFAAVSDLLTPNRCCCFYRVP